MIPEKGKRVLLFTCLVKCLHININRVHLPVTWKVSWFIVTGVVAGFSAMINEMKGVKKTIAYMSHIYRVFYEAPIKRLNKEKIVKDISFSSQ